jgi:putative hydrolase of the HAD superfamily
MSQHVIRAVYFDFYGTVATAAEWPQTPAAVLEQRGYPLTAAARKAWAREAREGLDHHEHSGSRNSYVAWDRARLRELVAACGAPPQAAESIVDELWTAKRPQALRVYPEVRAVLEELRSRRLIIGLCSNWDWDLDVDVERLGLGDCFDVIVSSARAGARKPHPRIFRYALERVGLPAEEVLFVGDAVVPDVRGPSGVGMRAAFLARAQTDGWVGLGALENGDRPAPRLPPGVARLRDLRDALALVTAV